MVSRADHRRATLIALADAAVDLYGADGHTEPTVDEVAARAGVSRRTAFRYIERKEDLVFLRHLLWLDSFDEAVAAHADDSITVRLLRGAEAVSRSIDDDPAPVRQALAVAGRTPALAVGIGTVNRRWIERVDAEIALDHPDEPFKNRVIAAAFMGVIDAALAAWAGGDGHTSLVDVVAEGAAIVMPLLDPGPSRAGT